MKKALLLIIAACLTMGSLPALAQEQPETPRQKIRIIITEEGDTQVYEYNSIEEMQADERLKDNNITMLKAADLQSRIAQGLLQEPVILRRYADSVHVDRTHFFYRTGANAPELLFLRDSADRKAVDIFRTERGTPVLMRDITILDPALKSMEELSPAMQQVLKEQGLELKEGEKVVIVRHLEHPPVPPAPPLPAGVPVPPAPGVAETASDWLEMKVSPNPANGQLRVQFTSENSGAAVLRLRDMNGKVVHEEVIPEAATPVDKTIKLPAGSKGLHLLQIEQGGVTHTSRIYIK